MKIMRRDASQITVTTQGGWRIRTDPVLDWFSEDDPPGPCPRNVSIFPEGQDNACAELTEDEARDVAHAILAALAEEASRG